MQPNAINNRAQAAVGAALAIAECIRTLGPIPSGHLYARLMGYMSLETYEALIGILIEAGKIRRHRNHLLEWVGPKRTTLESQKTNNRKETTK